MADLLECLIQIKGVADTPRRLAARLNRRPHGREPDRLAADVVAGLAAAEACFSSCLSAMLAEDAPALAPLETPAAEVGEGRPLPDLLEEFGRQRRAVVHVLDRCSAAELNRIGIEPRRGPMTVADLVAVMLAHDTDQLGRLV